jgi:hypothetical protein
MSAVSVIFGLTLSFFATICFIWMIIATIKVTMLGGDYENSDVLQMGSSWCTAMLMSYFHAFFWIGILSKGGGM